MERGDLSNEVPPKFLFVFEGLIASLPTAAATARERAMCKLHRWDAAAKCWEINEIMLAHCWDITWRYQYRFEIVSFHPEAWLPALEKKLERERVPVANVWASTPNKLAQRLARMPDVQRVFHPNENDIFKYGSMGRLVRLQGVGFSPW